MSDHVPDDLLHDFIDGDVEITVAIHIAEHLDVCPACATRAATLEPLSAAFAAVDDPVPPADLTAIVLQRAAEPEPGPGLELAIGGALLATAAVAVAVFGDPIRAAVDLTFFADLLGTLGSAAHLAVASSTVATLGATAMAMLCTCAAARTAAPDWRLS